jgi:uncharacterized protein
MGQRRWFLGASTEWPGVEKVDVEITEVEALAAKHPDVATDLRAFQRGYRRLTSIVTEAL